MKGMLRNISINVKRDSTYSEGSKKMSCKKSSIANSSENQIVDGERIYMEMGLSLRNSDLTYQAS